MILLIHSPRRDGKNARTFTRQVPMTDQRTGDSPEKGCRQADTPFEAGDAFSSEVPVGMTLESIISLTGELEHLNELVMLHIGKSGGFTCTASYFTIVTPLLDMLEGEIRFRVL